MAGSLWRKQYLSFPLELILRTVAIFSPPNLISIPLSRSAKNGMFPRAKCCLLEIILTTSLLQLVCWFFHLLVDCILICSIAIRFCFRTTPIHSFFAYSRYEIGRWIVSRKLPAISWLYSRISKNTHTFHTEEQK